jgi:hypothetical protein
VVAPARDDEVDNPGEVENPGAHRAPDGLKPRLVTTNSRGEKGPEDGPCSQRTAFLHSARTRTSVRCAGRAEVSRSESAGPAARWVARVTSAQRTRSMVSRLSARRSSMTARCHGRRGHEPATDGHELRRPRAAVHCGRRAPVIRCPMWQPGGAASVASAERAARRNRSWNPPRAGPSGPTRSAGDMAGVVNRRWRLLARPALRRGPGRDRQRRPGVRW